MTIRQLRIQTYPMRERAVLLDKLAPLRLPGPAAEQAFAFQRQLEAGAQMDRPRLAAYQLYHLKRLVGFATAEVDAYRHADFAASVAEARTLADALSAIPILTRDALARDPLDYRSLRLPPGHSFAGQKRSSGTSGQVVAVETTNVSHGWQSGLNLRGQLWAARDLGKTFATIRVHFKTMAPYPEGVIEPRWGSATVLPFETGPSAHLDTKASLEQQWEWLSRIKPDYLLTYPSIIRAMAARAAREGRPPFRLLGVSTVGETVDAELRDACRSELGAELYDTYSAEELGVIALQCPNSRRYHTMDDALIVEVLGDDDRPVGPGQVGRLVITPLFNYATPLLRYDIGDLAERGAACSCGRCFAVLNRVVGRIRNIFRTRDGRTFWPSFGAKAYSSLVHVVQHQFRQLSYEELEVVFATRDPVSADIEEKIRTAILKKLPEPMSVRFRYVDEILREPGGKYQEFVCLIA